MKLAAALSCLLLSALAAVPAAAQQGEADPAARQALDAYGQCVARREAPEAARVLAMDFTSNRYRTGLRLLSAEAQPECARASVGAGNALRSSGLTMAGAIAEALLEGGADPVNVRLTRAADASTATYAPTDAVAQCMARSMPDQVGVLFAATPGTDEEAQAAAALLVAVEPCSRASGVTARIEMTVPALRAMVATAAFRLVASFEKTDAQG